MKAVCASYNGNPTLFIDDKPVPGLISWDSALSLENIALFRDAGVNYFSFMGNLFVPREGVPDEELTTVDGGMERMRLTPDNIDRTMESLLKVNPDLKVLPRIVLNAPRWWLKENPDETILAWIINRRQYSLTPRPAFNSPAWQKLWVPALAEVVNYFEEHWGEHIFGYHTGIGQCSEHTFCFGNLGDFSPIQKNFFRQWLIKKYGNLDELNQSWNKRYSNIDEVDLPDPERFCDHNVLSKSLFLPEQEQDLIDFLHFGSDQVADAILLQGKTVKETLKLRGSEKICGVFYGYTVFGSNSARCASGHNALDRVLESPDIDFICGPFSYAARQSGGTIMPQIVPGSINCHNKLFFNEDDTGTHIIQLAMHHGYMPADAAETFNVLRRNFLASWGAGGSQWWMDLHGTGWYLDPQICQEIAFQRKFAERHLENRHSIAEIAVFASQESAEVVRDNPAPLTGNLIEHQLAEISACGAPHDFYLLSDLPLLARTGKLKQYKLCIFLNCIAVPQELADCIDRELKNNNRSLLWFYAPGYIRGHQRSAEFSEELTGIHFWAAENERYPMTTEFWLDGHRFSYGLPHAVFPRLIADDLQAEELGYWVNGTRLSGQNRGTGASLVSRRFENFRSIWSASPGLPAVLISRFAAEANVHLFSERGDQIFCAPDWIGVHAKCHGALELRLPEECSLVNSITGEEYKQIRSIKLETCRGETLLFEKI